MDNINFENLRMWMVTIIALIGAFITIKTFVANIKQRKLDNTFKLLDYLRKHITEEQFSTFKELFHANNELAGIPENEFHFEDGRVDSVQTMFSEGGCGNGDIHNLIELFNLITPTLNNKSVNDELIWYEYGQLKISCYKWTKQLEKEKDTTHFYSDFNNYMEKVFMDLIYSPRKYYVYGE